MWAGTKHTIPGLSQGKHPVYAAQFSFPISSLNGQDTKGLEEGLQLALM